jgi:Uma2 family endonuclease
MTTMPLQTTDEILDAVEHLPDGATLIMPQVSWDDYERLLEGLAERPHFKVSYDCGMLEIMSPGHRHEAHDQLIGDLVLIACETLRLKLEKCGSTTWKRKLLARGAEADGSSYIQNDEEAIFDLKADIESLPPPDLVVEIDLTNSSTKKFGIYAALEVPEMWVYDGLAFQFYRLSKGRYMEVQVSASIPGLTGQLIADALEVGNTRGQDAARAWFRRKFRSVAQRKR